MTKPLALPPGARHLFIVRIWREEGELPPGGQWRGSVEHVPSGQRVHFVSLETLSEFIEQSLTADQPILQEPPKR